MRVDDLKWDQILRFRLIEIIVLWEGRLTTNHLCDAFKIGRQQASRDIAKYKSRIEHEQLVLDQRIKGYRPSSEFKPQLIKGSPGEYLSFLHQQHSMDSCFEFFNWGSAESEILTVPARAVSPAIVRNLITAARECRRVDVGYISLTTPVLRDRVITPHTIIFDGVRWHVRAYCEEKTRYIDLVLSRFRGEAELMDKSKHGRAGDTDWHEMVELLIIPNPHLTDVQQDIVATDYNMVDGKLALNIRQPLLMYYKKRFNVCEDQKLLEEKPTEYQLTVEQSE
ncbi:MAG: WYL domain-containing protein [Algicola sp.]|nr:WYL domain-containing protein [Algicola sp.]